MTVPLDAEAMQYLISHIALMFKHDEHFSSNDSGDSLMALMCMVFSNENVVKYSIFPPANPW
ncbi:hypothetical protein T4B_9464 [Trichinella pseudospiralis]|uniref:Uncharacterized protein n=1 Tax=Trichinella pseudospiralis TaxID=6337 RepID=A0A0V1JMG8_TRIPS|nr:hypothetical protein T4B_9464 [Trichinella pseudospiralis]KRZ36164.1 hypothetical protein T4C_319 [Trichinella pseudospiralis]